MFNLFDAALNQGFSAAVVVYLLYERGKFNKDMVATMQEISTIIKERLPRSV